MLKLAVAAQLPIIGVSTRDTMNLPDVMKEITGKTATMWLPNMQVAPHSLYMVVAPDPNKLPLVEIYQKMVKAEASLIVVNGKVVEPMFDAGEVPVPRTLMLKFMKAVVEDTGKAITLLRGLGGCTIKEAAELARLTMARDNSLTVQGLLETRKSSFQASQGLAQVDVRQGFYDPPHELALWVAKEKPFFLDGTDHRLIPRGLLLDGPPGVGKTAASKWLAEQFGIPLYRVDIGGTKGKYVGQSENQMLTNLSRLDHEEPCVALLDEVEKVFASSNNDTSGTTSTMLSQLLWWLAEHKSKVLVIMTTNNAKALPKELYREGRIDQVLWFGGLEEDPARSFIAAVLQTFKKEPTPDVVETILNATHEIADTAPVKYSQAALTEAVKSYVKAVKTPVFKPKIIAQS